MCRGSPALGLKSPPAARLASALVWTEDGSRVPVSQRRPALEERWRASGVEKQRWCCQGSPMESCGQALGGLLCPSDSRGCCGVT